MQFVEIYLFIRACMLMRVILHSQSYTFRCPYAVEWNLKANITCSNSSQYYCLLCPTTEVYECLRNPGGGYVEGCGGPVQDRKGHKKIIAGSFTRENCTENRYQPVIFNTNETSDCIYKKSDCIEQGQVIFNNGSGRTDRLCSCNYQTGYAYVETLQTQFCCPSGYKDCSCYVKSCDKFQSADYKCLSTGVTGKNENNRTSEILNHADLKFINEDSKLIRDKVEIRQQSKTKITWLICSTIAICVIFVICVMSGKLENVFCTDVSLLETNSVDDKSSLLNTAETKKEDIESGDYTEMFITEWQDEDKKFVVTHASEHVLECIKKNSCVTVTGSSGVGKTVTIRHVALRMKQEGYKILDIKYPRDIEKLLQQKNKVLCVVDDCCGKYHIDQIDLQSWKKEIKNIQRLVKELVCKIIIGCRLQIYQDRKFETLSLFKSYVCNMQSKELCLTETERQAIAEFYLKENITKIPKENTFDFFPLLCSLSKGKSGSEVQKLFENPFSVYKTELDEMEKEGSHFKRCVLALVVVFNNKLQEDWLTGDLKEEMRPVFENVCEKCKLNRGTSRCELLDELDSLITTFLNKRDNVYSFIHDKLFDIVAHYFGQQMTSCLITYADSSFIRERFLYFKITDIDHFIILLPQTLRQNYVDRLMEDWSRGQVVDVFSNNNLQTVPFQETFLSHIKALPRSSQYTLANTMDKLTKDTTLIWICYLGNKDVAEWCLSLNADVNITAPDGTSPLYKACQEGHTEIVNMLLDHNADVNKCIKDGTSPLVIACQEGHIEIVNMLLKQNKNVNKCRNDGVSPLYIACENGHTTIVDVLLKHNSDVNNYTNDGKSPLYIACYEGHTQIVDVLLKHNADFNKCTNDGMSPLYSACHWGHIEIVCKLENAGADFNKCCDIGASPLFVACQFGHEEIVSRLLNTNVDINRCVNDGASPLFIACHNGRTEIVKKLLNRNADINKCYNDGTSPLHIACEKGHTAIVKELVDKNADINSCAKNRQSPLFIACENGHIEIVEILLKKHADINICDIDGLLPSNVAYDNGYTDIYKYIFPCHSADINQIRVNRGTPLFIACQRGRTDSVSNLLQNKNADINTCGNRGASPLFMACRNGHHKIVNMLLDHNANVNNCTHDGTSPLYIACEKGHTEIVSQLLDKHADIDTCTNNKQSPLFIACLNGHTEIVGILIDKNADVNKCNKDGLSPVNVANNTKISVMLRNKLKQKPK